MKEITGNLWDQKADALCITTNGYVKNNGEAVMGRGCAKEAATRYKGLSLYLGQTIKRSGNNVRYVAPETLMRMDTKEWEYQAIASDYSVSDVVLFKSYPWRHSLVFFPVKHFWRDQADFDLITRSAHELVALTDRKEWESVVLPRPGCGNGRLPWFLVKDTIEPILDDRFSVITFE